MDEILQRRITAIEKRILEHQKKEKLLKNKIKKIQIYAENKQLSTITTTINDNK